MTTPPPDFAVLLRRLRRARRWSQEELAGRAAVAAALERLTEEQRAVVLYRCVLGYATDEVAALLRKRPKAIRALQSRALASLARHLGLDRRREAIITLRRAE